MNPWLRSILVVVAGVVVGGIAVFALEMLGMTLFPLPDGVDPMDPESLAAAAAAGQIPLGAMIMVLAAWLVGALIGGYVAARLAAREALKHALVVGAVFTVLDLGNILTIPSPIWMAVLGVGLPVPAAYLGSRWAPRREAGEAIGTTAA